ncbi:CocE/NonD family hydrolase [Stenotrophobium rhamnosiphilum]|uniref:Peptidase S15 n=1 Tax=Stenotrophobium rhamnosiphilum TaxID=2029166 RepID=A0A2T5MGQ0_9GAMM|nr:CocE/NonD family hydrolase [Stenotrophobium rhamnosiphilum]PTU31737.1 peptidase S15 [Stenotrophobium rhamnosiphilum]
MQNTLCKIALLTVLVALTACGRSSSPDAGSGSSGDGNVTVPVTTSRAGNIYRQAINVSVTGDTQVFQVFEPTQLVEGQSYPLVLQGHGYGGHRETTAADGSFIKQLRDAGYYVISIDERGDGESSGTVRVMDPDYEGQDLIAILDWAENLEGLRRRANGDMMVGSYGGSYGGMYQFLLAGADPKHRLRVIAPNITPHDLTYALNSGNVVKSGWGLALVAGGELPLLGLVGGDVTGLLAALPETLARVAGGDITRQDPTIFETLVQAGLTNTFSTTGLNFFKYHSVSYFCDGLPPGPQSFILPISVPDTFLVSPTPFAKIDALITQGMPDTLFNFNNGYANYQCLKKMGGDVRLMSHQGGHILPVGLGTVPLPPGSDLEAALDPFYAAINPPEFQDAGGATACGGIKVQDANFAWFEEKLQGKKGAIKQVVTTGKDICMSLADGDAIQVRDVKRGGKSYTINSSTPQLNSLLGVVGSLLGTQVREALLSVQPFYTAPEQGAVVAGIPTLKLKMQGLTGAEMGDCTAPVGVGACDPILFVAIGVLRAGSANWEPINAQYTPVRGFGDHNVDMNGISVRLQPGDKLGLLVSAFTAQYPITWSRDILVPAITLSGSFQVPILSSSDIVRQGI